MKAKTGFAAAALWLLTSSVVVAADKPLLGSLDGKMNVMGRVDCGFWLSTRQGGRANAYEWYVIGELNGLARGMSADFWGWKGHLLSSAQAFFWLDKYCQDKPLSFLPDGVAALFTERTGLRLWGQPQ